MINPEAVEMDKNSKRKSSKSTTKGHTKWELQSNRQTRGEKQQIKVAKFRAANSVRLTSSTQYQHQYESGYLYHVYLVVLTLSQVTAGAPSTATVHPDPHPMYSSHFKSPIYTLFNTKVAPAQLPVLHSTVINLMLCAC